MPENITPEEKLLKLIENPAAAKPSRNPGKKIRFGFQVIKGWLKAIKNITIGVNSPKIEELFNLRSINKTLIVVSSLFSVYLIFDFIQARPNLERVYSLHNLKQTKQLKLGLNNIPSLNDYLGQINKRDIFHFIPLKKEEPDKTKETLASIINNLKLVGIIWSKTPEVMIEDKEENKTWILNQGDEILKVKGKIKIKQILKDRAIISFQDQEMELM
jgi:hypothetical protein